MSAPGDVAVSVGVRRWMALVGIGIFLGMVSQVATFVPDPAWASLRYAANVAAGAGPVWNVGGAPVEGYTSSLLVGVQVLATLAHIDPLRATQSIGLAAALTTLVLLYRRGGDGAGPVSGAMAALFAAVSPTFALWSVGGTETPLVALVVTFATLRLCGGSAVVSGATLALLPLLQPGGAIIAIPIALIGSLGTPDAKRRLVQTLLPVLTVACLLTLLRLSRFGVALPNSVRIRFGTSDPLGSASEFVTLVAPALPLAVLGAFAGGGRTLRVAATVVGVAIATLFTMDSVTAFARHAVPFWPLIALLAARGVPLLARLQPAVGGGIAFVAGTLAVTSCLLGVPGYSIAATKSGAQDLEICRSALRTQAAEWLKPRLGRDDVYGVSDAGEFSLVAGGTSLDLLGLHDPTLATSGRGGFGARARWALAQSPAWLVLRGKADTEVLRPFYGHERALVSDENFASTYTFASSFTKADCDLTMWVYQRR